MGKQHLAAAQPLLGTLHFDHTLVTGNTCGRRLQIRLVKCTEEKHSRCILIAWRLKRQGNSPPAKMGEEILISSANVAD